MTYKNLNKTYNSTITITITSIKKIYTYVYIKESTNFVDICVESSMMQL